LVFDSGVVQVTENILYVMFAFRWGSLHFSKDFCYIEDNIVLSSIYEVPNVNFKGMF
jgi:hypothetical protein